MLFCPFIMGLCEGLVYKIIDFLVAGKKEEKKYFSFSFTFFFIFFSVQTFIKSSAIFFEKKS
jgi:hypothetical protein